MWIILYDAGYDGLGVCGPDMEVLWGPNDGAEVLAYKSEADALAAIEAHREKGRRSKKGSLANDLFVVEARIP